MILKEQKLPILSYREVVLQDTQRSDWAYEYIQTALIRHWTDEPEDGFIKPHEPLTRAQAIELLVRAKNISLDVPSYAKASDFAQRNGLRPTKTAGEE